jgi:hypothetical protein
MRFVAELEGEPHVLENLAPCLQGNYARLRRIGNRWVLESSAFDQCKAGQEVFPEAEMLVSHIQAILAIYLQLHDAFRVVSILWLNAKGRPFRRSLRSHINVNTYSAKGILELASLRGVESLGTALAHRAAAHAAFREALALVEKRPLRWSQIYDVIEFLGAERIATTGWATRRDIVRIRRTANYYRHLGRPKKDTLPKNPPTLANARTFAFNLLKRWIATLP